MQVKVLSAKLKRMEVINVRTGCRLGMLKSCTVECESGRILSLAAAGGGVHGFGCREVCVPWQQVVRIGADAILVDCEGEAAHGSEPCLRL